MITKKLLNAFLLLVPALWIGCAGQQQAVGESPETKKNRHYFTQIHSFGNQGFQAVMQYDTNEGFMKIIFLDENKSKIKIIDENKIRALLRPSNGISREFYFFNPTEFGRHYYSFPSESEPHPYEPTDVLYVRKNWLKNLSSFTLKMWIPVEETTYQVEYAYQGNRGIKRILLNENGPEK